MTLIATTSAIPTNASTTTFTSTSTQDKQVTEMLNLPQRCGQMDLIIRANGEWWHEGQRIQRSALIQLFSRVICLEDGEYFLKTPVEKIQIQVEDVPFFVQHIEQIWRDNVAYLQMTTTDQQTIIVDAYHAIEMRYYADEWRPYVHIRDGLYALIQRSVFYHLIDYGTLFENEQGEVILQLRSGDYCVELHQAS